MPAPKPDDEIRRYHVKATVTLAEKDKIEVVATMRGKSTSDYVRDLIMADLKKTKVSPEQVKKMRELKKKNGRTA